MFGYLHRMRSRSLLLLVTISASPFVGAGRAALAGSADSTPDTSDAGPATECPLPTAAAADFTVPVGSTEAADTTAPGDASEATEPSNEVGTTAAPADRTPAEAFFAGFCARAQDVAGIGPLLTGSPTRENSEQFREGLCDPEFKAPDREQSTQNWVIYIRGTAQTDPQSGATWLEAGVLNSYEEGDNDSTDLDEDVVEQLVDTEMAFLEEFEEHRDEWCADLVEPVETTEA